MSETDTILIVDDEVDLLHGLERTLSMDIDCRILLAENGPEALNLLQTNTVDLVLADINMPGMDGLELLAAVKDLDPAITVIIMTAYGTIEKAVEAIKGDAYDFIQKPFDDERLIHILKKGLERNRLVRENARLLKQVREQTPVVDIVGKSRPMVRVLDAIQMLARTDVTVLVLGETGTGKDLAARAIHGFSNRKEKPLVTVNCPAAPENLLESELSGYVKGAFTNAGDGKRGLFEKAHAGTIFLDEIGDLSSAVQTKLLRVLQEKEIKPLGSNTSRNVDVRIIAATNRDLASAMESGQFREDLYYRLNVATLAMPSLNDMPEDIPLLVEHFLEKAAQEQGMTRKQVSPEVMNYLLAREWPGNVRELENTLLGWCAMSPADMIQPAVLPVDMKPCLQPGNGTSLERPYKELKDAAIESFTIDYLTRLLQHTRGNITQAAQISGIKRQSLQKIIKRYSISVEQFR